MSFAEEIFFFWNIISFVTLKNTLCRSYSHLSQNITSIYFHNTLYLHNSQKYRFININMYLDIDCPYFHFLINSMHCFIAFSDADVFSQLSYQTTYQLTSLLFRHLRSNPLKRASLCFLLDLYKQNPNITYLLKVEHISKNIVLKLFGRCQMK